LCAGNDGHKAAGAREARHSRRAQGRSNPSPRAI
jgi:hypothetical protein